MNIGVIFVILIFLLLSGVPVLFAFGGTTIALVAAYGFDPASLFATSYTQLSSVTLLAIPLFIISGGIMEKGHIGEKVSASEWISMLWKRTGTAIPALIMPFIILGGIYSGAMTASESAGIACLYAIPVAMFIYKKMNVRQLGETLHEGAVTTGVVMCMIGVVMMMSRVLTQVGLPQTICNALLSISDNKYVILLMINVFLVILGMIMDDTSATLLAAPILYPVIQRLGISPYQFAAILGVNIGMGNITPPSAPFLYLSARIFGTDAGKMMKPVLWLLFGAYLPTLILTTLIPEVSLFLPRLIMGAKLGI